MKEPRLKSGQRANARVWLGFLKWILVQFKIKTQLDYNDTDDVHFIFVLRLQKSTTTKDGDRDSDAVLCSFIDSFIYIGWLAEWMARLSSLTYVVAKEYYLFV